MEVFGYVDGLVRARAERPQDDLTTAFIQAEVDGERWRVRSAALLQPGQRVRVTRVDGLTLWVRPHA